MTSEPYRVRQVPARGGALTIGEWGPADGPVLLAIHGITASHLAWQELAALLPDVRIVAPDLRGRGRSAALPPPYGMAQHAADCAAVLDALGIGRAVVVGHSMGAFVATAFAAAHPTRVARLVLVDGGLPLRAPEGMTRDEAIRVSLGAALARLTMTFPTRAAYRDFWRAHPSFQDGWSESIEAYADYDLVDVAGGFRPPTPIAAVGEDSVDLYEPNASGPLAHLPAGTVLLTAPRGLQNAAPLYPPAALAAWGAVVPALTITQVPDVNHYTIVMGPAGAAVVASHVRRALL